MKIFDILSVFCISILFAQVYTAKISSIQMSSSFAEKIARIFKRCPQLDKLSITLNEGMMGERAFVMDESCLRLSVSEAMLIILARIVPYILKVS